MCSLSNKLAVGARVQLAKDMTIDGLPMGGKGLTGRVTSINGNKADVTFDVDPGANHMPTLMISEVKLHKLEKVEPEPSSSSSPPPPPPPSTKKNKAAAPEQPKAAKRARRGGKEPAAASDDTHRAGTTVESGGSSSRRSSVRPLHPRTSPSLIDPGVLSTKLTPHHSRARTKTRLGRLRGAHVGAPLTAAHLAGAGRGWWLDEEAQGQGNKQGHALPPQPAQCARLADMSRSRRAAAAATPALLETEVHLLVVEHGSSEFFSNPTAVANALSNMDDPGKQGERVVYQSHHVRALRPSAALTLHSHSPAPLHHSTSAIASTFPTTALATAAVAAAVASASLATTLASATLAATSVAASLIAAAFSATTLASAVATTTLASAVATTTLAFSSTTPSSLPVSLPPSALTVTSSSVASLSINPSLTTTSTTSALTTSSLATTLTATSLPTTLSTTPRSSRTGSARVARRVAKRSATPSTTTSRSASRAPR